MNLERMQEREVEGIKDDLELRKKEIMTIVNDFELNEVGEFYTFNAQAYRTAFDHYLRGFNSTQLTERKFSFKNLDGKWRVKRIQ